MSGARETQPVSTLTSASGTRLDSWKDIATYLKRSVPTVQRWEREEQLPVHRLLHKKQGSVYAFTSELDAWMQQRRGLVERQDEDDQETSRTAASPRFLKRWFIWPALAGLALIAIAGAVYIARNKRATAPGRTMIAVLPFQNLGGGPEREYECDGLTEDLITELAVLDPAHLGVIARTSAMAYKGRSATVRDVGRDLNVQYVIEGSVRFGGDRSRITAQLIRVSDQSHIWAQSFEEAPGEMFKLEEDIARRVASEVDVRLSASAPARPKETSNPEAYRLYMQGRELWSKRSHAELERSIELYQQALKFDPDYARAYAGIADSFNQLGYLGFRPLGYTVPEAQRAAQKALELDPNLAPAHAAIGFINAMWIWNWKEAESQYQRAIELDPSYVPAHHFYALFLASANRLQEADEQMATALRLDPLSASVNAGYAYILFFERKHAASLEYCQRALEHQADYAIAYAVRGWNLAQLGRYDEAIVAMQKALELAPENSLYIATVGRVYALSGRTGDADSSLKQLEELSRRKVVGDSMRAIVYAAKGDNDAALRWLKTATQQEDPFVLWLKVTPEFDSLRQDQRYAELVKSAALP